VAIIKSPLEKSLATYYKEGAVLEYDAFLEHQKQAGLPVPYTQEQVRHLVEDEKLVFTMYQVHPSAVRATLGLEPAATQPVLQISAATHTPEASPAETQVEPLTPLFVWQPVSMLDRASIKGLSAQEAFMIYLKASLMAGVIIASPWIFYQLWIFVAAGLYPTERRFVHIFLPVSLGLFLAGAVFCFFIIFQFVLDYLFKYNRQLGIAPDPRINEWLGFAIFLPVGFGLSFQLPLVMLFLNRIGVMSVANYLAKWRIAVLVIFVLAMILTPADPISMLSMALPLTALYFGGILICHWAGPRKNPLET
jgi:Tat protein translocase TatC